MLFCENMSTRASAFCGVAAGLGGCWFSPTGTMASEFSALGEPKSSPLKRSILGSGFAGVGDITLGAG